ARRGADRAPPEARRGDLPAGLARLGRRPRVDRRDRARVGYAVDLERGKAHVQRGLAGAGVGEATRGGFPRTASWARVGLLAAGCARKVADFAQKPGRRVVVIGGGWGGATAAKYVRLADPSIEVVLLEPNREFVSCPFSNLVLSGQRTIESLTFDYDGLRAHGVEVLHET